MFLFVKMMCSCHYCMTDLIKWRKAGLF